MDVQLVECSKIDVPKVSNDLRTFSKEFAVKMADGIKAEGMYVPIVVRKGKDGRYILVQGKHRLYAKKNVLKEQLIEANVIEDMDDAEAEMAMIAENLWRNPLTKPQHTICLKKWFEHYMARNPNMVGKGKAGAIASAAARKKRAEDSDTKDQTDGGAASTTTDEAKEESQEEESKVASFAETVAATTGQSVAAATRSARIARTFDAEQLEVFNQMSVNQTDMLTIAKIKDEAQRGAVVNLIASGMEVADAIKSVMGDKAPIRDNGNGKAEAEAKAATAADKAPELTNDQWFDTYCGEKANMLANPARYKADALLFREVCDLRHTFRSKAKKFVKATRESKASGLFWSLVNRFCGTSHPKDWLICPDCKGHGTPGAKDDLAGATKCGKCYGGGYLLKTEEYL